MTLESQFVLQNAHFALSLLSAFVFFAAFWLYLDAWFAKRNSKELFKLLGFLLLSLSFLIHATIIETGVLEESFLKPGLSQLLTTIFRMSGYIALLIGLTIDPLQSHLHSHEREKAHVITPVLFISAGISLLDGTLLLPVLCALVGFLYLRRATLGLENHLKSVALSFFMLSLSELLSFGVLFRGTDNIVLLNLVSPFAPLWTLEHGMLLIAILILSRWVFSYLLKRIQTQLFIIFTTTVVVIFLVTTVTFTTLLLTNVEKDALSRLETDVSLLQYAIESKKESTLSDAQFVAQNGEIQKALQDSDRKRLREITVPMLLSKKQSSLIIIGKTGEVIMRAEDPEKVGDSLADDALFKRALTGDSITSIVSHDRALAPELSVRSLVPVKAENDTIGIVLVGSNIDNALLDGIKKTTHLETAVYANNMLSATTFIAPDGKSRYIGIKEETETVKKKVFDEGKTYGGDVTVLSMPYFGVYAPLLDIDNNPVGMLFVGKDQVTILQAANASIEFTFIITAILIVCAVLPVYLISRYLSGQLQ